MNVDFSCPRCKSEATQRLLIVYQAGLSSIDTRSTSKGAAFSQHRAAVGAIQTHTEGTSQTEQSKNASPPPRKRFLLPLFLIGLACFGIKLFGQSAIYHFLVTLLWAGASFTWLGYALKYNMGEWPKLVDQWRKLFICMRCDNVFPVDITD